MCNDTLLNKYVCHVFPASVRNLRRAFAPEPVRALGTRCSWRRWRYFYKGFLCWNDIARIISGWCWNNQLSVFLNVRIRQLPFVTVRGSMVYIGLQYIICNNCGCRRSGLCQIKIEDGSYCVCCDVLPSSLCPQFLHENAKTVVSIQIRWC